jgi:hypothetical protein
VNNLHLFSCTTDWPYYWWDHTGNAPAGVPWIDYVPDTTTTTGGDSTIFGFKLPTYDPFEDLKANSKQKPSEVEISDIEILDEDSINSSAFAKASLQKQPDLLYVRFKMVHEGGNKNMDFFRKDFLEAAYDTPVLKFIDWEHGEKSIGTLYHTEFVDADKDAKAASKDDLSHIIAEGVIWKFKYKDEARRMIKRHKDGNLSFSMEAYFSEAECSKCGSVFAADTHTEDDYCDCLKNRSSTPANASDQEPVFRILRGFIFGGVGVVEDPADIDAGSLAMAKQKEVTRLADEIKLTKAELDAKLEEARTNALAEAEKESNVEELKTKLADAESSLKEKSDALTDATKSVEDLTKERDEIKAELDELKDSINREKAEGERLEALTEAGYEAPSDEAEAKLEMDLIMKMDADVFDYHVKKIKARIKPKEGDNTPRAPATGSTKPKASKKDDEPSVAEQVGDLFSRL